MAAKNKKPDYEELGRMIEHVYETAYVSRSRLARMSFLKGLAYGAGGVVGAGLVLLVLGWVLTVLHYVPFVNLITDQVQESLQESQQIRQPEQSIAPQEYYQ